MRANDARTVSAAASDDIVLLTRLTRLRRRVRLILLVRHTLVSLSVAAIVASVVLVWPSAIPATALVALFAVAGVSAVSSAFLRTPTIREIAALVDGRLQLADEVVMALALRGNHEAIARLIVRNTLAQMTAERMAGVCPFELGRPAMYTVGAAVLCVAVMAGVSGRRATSIAAGPSQARDGIGGGQVPSSRGPSSTTDDAVARQGARETSAAQSQPAATPAGTDATLQEADTERRRIDDSKPEASSDLALKTETNRPSSSGTDRVERPGGSQTGASPRDQTARAGGTGTGTSSGDDPNASGGIQRGDLRAAAPIATAPGDPEYRATYRAARTRADAALARDEVPRSRWAHVRDYFLAIAPRD